MNNPMQFINMIKGMKNPKEAVMQMMKNNNNPVLQDLVKKVESGDTKSVENFARNMFKEQNRDFDNEFSQFMSNFR